jgi:hypothetical protein
MPDRSNDGERQGAIHPEARSRSCTWRQGGDGRTAALLPKDLFIYYAPSAGELCYEATTTTRWPLPRSHLSSKGGSPSRRQRRLGGSWHNSHISGSAAR